MECCQCQQERQKYLKQIWGESRGGDTMGRGFQSKANWQQEAGFPLPPWFSNPQLKRRGRQLQHCPRTPCAQLPTWPLFKWGWKSIGAQVLAGQAGAVAPLPNPWAGKGQPPSACHTPATVRGSPPSQALQEAVRASQSSFTHSWSPQHLGQPQGHSQLPASPGGQCTAHSRPSTLAQHQQGRAIPGQGQ